MFRLILGLSVLASAISASAFSIDVSKAGFSPSGPTEFVFENIRLSNQSVPQWGRFQWNPQNNSFVLVDFAPMSPSVVGKWDLLYDIDCDGSTGRTTWTLRQDGSCISGENRQCRWLMSQQGDFTLEYITGGRVNYTGRFKGGSLSGQFRSQDGRVHGCWSAMKINMLPERMLLNQMDPRARRDSAGMP